MERTREPGKKTTAGKRAQACLLLPPLLVALAFLQNGCNGLQKLKGTSTSGPPQASGDPLLGSDPAQKAAPANSGSTRAKSTSLPAIPTSNSSSSNVAMAVGEPLPGSRPLAIEDQSKPPSGWKGPAPAGTTSTPNNGITPVQLQRPEAIVDPVQRPVAIPLPPASSAPAATTDLDQLQAQLKQRGVSLQRQETVPEGVKFTCAVPNRHNPDISRFYEATARDLPAAVRATIQQIDADPN